MVIGTLDRPVETIPKLQPGDCLTRDEFERRYRAMPECKKAELIEGVVYMPSPARLKRHGQPHQHLIGWLAAYEATTPGVIGAVSATNRLDLENEPQPDSVLFIDPECGGQAWISADDYLTGPPEFAAEVSGSTVAVDRGPKLRTFRRHGVLEYLIWRVQDQIIEWNILRGGAYEHLQPQSGGILRSEAFPGLWLDAEALMRGDLAGVLEVLRQGIASDEHQAFVQKLQSQKTK